MGVLGGVRRGEAQRGGDGGGGRSCHSCWPSAKPGWAKAPGSWLLTLLLALAGPRRTSELVKTRPGAPKVLARCTLVPNAKRQEMQRKSASRSPMPATQKGRPCRTRRGSQGDGRGGAGAGGCGRPAAARRGC